MMASPDNLLARTRRTQCRNSAITGTMEHDYYSYLQDERRTPYPDDDEALVARQASRRKAASICGATKQKQLARAEVLANAIVKAQRA